MARALALILALAVIIAVACEAPAEPPPGECPIANPGALLQCDETLFDCILCNEGEPCFYFSARDCR